MKRFWSLGLVRHSKGWGESISAHQTMQVSGCPSRFWYSVLALLMGAVL